MCVYFYRVVIAIKRARKKMYAMFFSSCVIDVFVAISWRIELKLSLAVDCSSLSSKQLFRMSSKFESKFRFHLVVCWIVIITYHSRVISMFTLVKSFRCLSSSILFSDLDSRFLLSSWRHRSDIAKNTIQFSTFVPKQSKISIKGWTRSHLIGFTFWQYHLLKLRSPFWEHLLLEIGRAYPMASTSHSSRTIYQDELVSYFTNKDIQQNAPGQKLRNFSFSSRSQKYVA